MSAQLGKLTVDTVDLCSALMMIQCGADSKAFEPWCVGVPQQAQLARSLGKLAHWCPRRMTTTADKRDWETDRYGLVAMHHLYLKAAAKPQPSAKATHGGLKACWTLQGGL